MNNQRESKNFTTKEFLLGIYSNLITTNENREVFLSLMNDLVKYNNLLTMEETNNLKLHYERVSNQCY